MRLDLRPATAEDSPFLWAWRNDPETRAASFETAPISLPDHRTWFDRALADPNRTLLVGVNHQGERVGVVRLDSHGSRETLVSINVAPEHRGRGVGEALLRAALASGGPYVAEVRADNTRSIRLFERCGFTRRSATADAVVFERS